MTQVTYVTLPANNTFICEVILPEKSPIRGLTGTPAMKKSTAKQSAAFDTCLLLRKHRLLDDNFRSIYYRRLPAMRNAKLAITLKHTNEYDMISKPSFWDMPEESTLSRLYAVTLSFSPSKALSREYGTLVLLTRQKYPELPAFSIFLDDDVETTINSRVMEDAMEVSKEDMECLTDFTLRVFRDVFQKVYNKEPEKMPYWLAPALKAVQQAGASHPRQLIDWETISYVQDNEEIRFSEDMDPGLFVNRFAYDPWDGRFRLFTTAIDDTLRPTDPPPSFVARRRFMDNIMSYCLSLSKNSRAKFFSNCNWNQPVFHAELVRLRRNLLDKMTDNEKDSGTKCVVCMEALRISVVCVIVFFYIYVPANSISDPAACCYFLFRLPGYYQQAGFIYDSPTSLRHLRSHYHPRIRLGSIY